MITQVQHFCRENMQRLTRLGPFADHVWVVSIRNSGEPSLLFPRGAPTNLLFLAFDDIETEEKGYARFTEDQARAIVDFILAAHEKVDTAVTLVTHCEAGMSRSAAVAEFARRVAGIDFERFRRDNFPQPFYPNGWVLRCLVREWMSRLGLEVDG